MREFTPAETAHLQHHIRISDIFNKINLYDKVQILWRENGHPRLTKGKVISIDYEMQDIIVKDDTCCASMILIGAIDDITILAKHVQIRRRRVKKKNKCYNKETLL